MGEGQSVHRANFTRFKAHINNRLKATTITSATAAV